MNKQHTGKKNRSTNANSPKSENNQARRETNEGYEADNRMRRRNENGSNNPNPLPTEDDEMRVNENRAQRRART
jgi:hypothetical protein